MKDQEREVLREENRMLKILLDFHVRNREKIAMSDAEFEQYMNAVLDRLFEIEMLLKEK